MILFPTILKVLLIILVISAFGILTFFFSCCSWALKSPMGGLINITLNGSGPVADASPANDGPEQPEVAATDDTPTMEQLPLSGTCLGVIASGAVNVILYDAVPQRLVLESTPDRRLQPPVMSGGILMIHGLDAEDAEDEEELPTVHVYARGISQVTHHGSGEMWAEHLTGTHLRATSSGSANLHIGGEGGDAVITAGGSGNIDFSWMAVDQLSVVMAGSGYVQPTGSWKELDATLNGSGKLRADGAQPATVRIRSHGDGAAYVGSARSLDAIVRGNGTVTYAGAPEPLIKQLLGSGTIDAEP